jgi:peptidoglycan/xylan/chitin deacetylase (PgdA/CDA1 family)
VQKGACHLFPFSFAIFPPALGGDDTVLREDNTMPPGKLLLLELYYRATCPYRWWWHRRAAAADREPVIVLFYHRIADDRASAWTTSNRTFARQIEWLARHFDLVSLEEAQRRIRVGNDRPCASITFDDGYAENCRAAIPLLIRRRIPCTYFVTLENAIEGKPFPHDVAEGNRFPPNDLDQLRAMADAGIEIGAHTYTHADLAQVTDEEQLHREVVEAGRELQARLGRPVRYFAFPFGQHVNLIYRAFQLAREAGYEAVCSAYGGYNFPGDDAFHLQRVHVDDDMIRLRNRATVDPRKVATPRFVYETGASEPSAVSNADSRELAIVGRK